MTEDQQSGDVIDLVETFIQRCHDLDYVFTEAARKMVVQGSDPPTLWANSLASAMTNYMRNKNQPDTRIRYADACLAYINRALSIGVVTEGPGLIRRNKEAEARVKELETENKKLSNENYHLRVSLDQMKDALAT